jgi:hypothetical protein
MTSMVYDGGGERNSNMCKKSRKFGHQAALVVTGNLEK